MPEKSLGPEERMMVIIAGYLSVCCESPTIRTLATLYGCGVGHAARTVDALVEKRCIFKDGTAIVAVRRDRNIFGNRHGPQ